MRTRAVKDAEVTALAKDLLSEYRRSKSLLRALGTVAKSRALPDGARAVANRLKVSQALARSDLSALPNAYLAELFSIVAFGIENGTAVDEALEMFVRRLEGEISLRNRLRTKTGGAQALTYMGMGVFFPLFSSISAVILNSSLGLFGSAGGVPSGFALLCAAYVPIVLFLSASFAHPESSPIRNALSVAPCMAVAFCIMLFVPQILLHVL